MKKNKIVLGLFCLIAAISLLFYALGVPTSLPTDQNQPDSGNSEQTPDDDDQGNDDENQDPSEEPDNGDDDNTGGETPPTEPDDGKDDDNTGGETPPENPDDDNQKDHSRITLAEAKAFILQVLNGDSVIAQMGTFKFFWEDRTESYPGKERERVQTKSGTFTYQGDRCVTGDYSETNIEKNGTEWYPAEYDVYFADGTGYKRNQDHEVTTTTSYWDPSQLPQYLFADDTAFAAYDGQVQRQNTNTGFTLTLHANWENCFQIQNGWARQSGQMDEATYQSNLKTYLGWGQNYSEDILNEMGWTTVLYFDRDGNLVKVAFELFCPGAGTIWHYLNIEIEKTDTAIQEPSWVTDYLTTPEETPEEETEHGAD